MLKPKTDAACDCPPANDNNHCGDGACAIPAAKNDNNPAPKKNFLSGLFRKCAACAGSGAAGMLAGHMGCIITPLVLAATGATVATAGMSVLALAFGAAATAGGLYAWHRLRGHTAGKWEKRITIGAAVGGLVLSSAFHLANMQEHKHHHMQEPAPVTAPAPASHHHHHM